MPQPPKIAWGSEAAKSRDWFNTYQAKKLLRKPKTEDEEVARKKLPGYLTDPQGHIIRTRIRRFAADIGRVSQHYCHRRLRQQDYLGFILKETNQLLRSVSAMGSVRFSEPQVRDKAREITDDVARALQGYPGGQAPLGAVRDLTNLAVSRLEQVLEERRSQSTISKVEEKNSQISKKVRPELAPAFENKLRALGISAQELPGLIETARAMGVDVDGIMAKLEAGEEPEELKGLLGG